MAHLVVPGVARRGHNAWRRRRVGVPRLTAHRELAWLHDAGLVGRARSAEDRAHAWWYGITGEGVELLGHALAVAGAAGAVAPGPAAVGGAHYLLFLPLLAASRQDPGRCGLFQWLATLDTSVWLRKRGLAHLRADGYGVWLEDGRCVRFLVHVDPDQLLTSSPNASGPPPASVESLSVTGAPTPSCRSVWCWSSPAARCPGSEPAGGSTTFPAPSPTRRGVALQATVQHFGGTAEEDQHELLIIYNVPTGWLVRHSLTHHPGVGSDLTRPRPTA